MGRRSRAREESEWVGREDRRMGEVEMEKKKHEIKREKGKVDWKTLQQGRGTEREDRRANFEPEKEGRRVRDGQSKYESRE